MEGEASAAWLTGLLGACVHLVVAAMPKLGPMRVALSEGTRRRVEMLFAEAEREEVIDTIVRSCGNNLPFCENSTPESLERIRFAALKLSEGNLDKLFAAIRLAQEDWRDLLVAAGFADDIHAHATWWPKERS